jgi:hypothetical protein
MDFSIAAPIANDLSAGADNPRTLKNWSSGFRASARYRATDSIPPLRVKHGPMANKITTVSCAPLLAEAIRRLHEDKPLSDLLVF